MNLLDLFIVLLVLIQAIRWAIIGFARGVFSFGGFWLGFIAGTLLAPFSIALADDPLLKLTLTLVTIFGLAMLGGILGRIAGEKLAAVTER